MGKYTGRLFFAPFIAGVKILAKRYPGDVCQPCQFIQQGIHNTIDAVKPAWFHKHVRFALYECRSVWSMSAVFNQSLYRIGRCLQVKLEPDNAIPPDETLIRTGLT